MPDPTVSIIIPVYNVEKYLPSLLDSILSQTYEDYEVILIDDGSSDSSGRICDTYTSKDQRIRSIHKDNGGVSSARNIGIEEAHGEYVYFCDADDELFPQTLQILVKYMEQGHKFVMAGYEVVDGATSEQSPAFDPKIITPSEGLVSLFDSPDNRYNGYLWTKLFRTDIIKENQILFQPEIHYNEDRLFIFEYLTHMNGTVAYISTPIYRYFKRQESAMSSIHRGQYRKFYTDLDAFIIMYRQSLHLKDGRLSSIVKRHTYMSYEGNINLTLKYSRTPHKEIAELKDKVKNLFNFRDILLYKSIIHTNKLKSKAIRLIKLLKA